MDLAERSGIGCSTVRNFEGGRHALMRSNMAMLRSVLEAAGVIFIEADVQGPGVRLRNGSSENTGRPNGPGQPRGGGRGLA